MMLLFSLSNSLRSILPTSSQRIASFLIISALFHSPAYAQSAMDLDSKAPIEITADALEVLQGQRKAIFTGDVEAIQGNITLKAERMQVYYRDASEKTGNMGAVKRIEVDQNVMLSTPQESAKAKRGIYNVDDEMITLLGEVILARGKNMLRGGRLDYNLKTQKSLLSNNASGSTPDGQPTSGGRVKGVFVPGQ